LTDSILSYPEFKVLNFGHIPGHEQKIDFYKNMEKFQKAGKINYNCWPRFPNESSEEHLVRLHKFASQGVLAPISGALTDLSSREILDLWRSL
jgi:hypothetical protein